MNWQSDETYLLALCEGRNSVLQEIYRRFAPEVKSWVLRNNGSGDDAKDLMQDALIAIYDRYCSTEFRFTGTFGGLLMVIVRRLWFDRLSKKKREQDVRKEGLYESSEEGTELEAAEEALSASRRMEVLNETLTKLSEQCQKLLALIAAGEKDPEKLASELGIPSANAVYQAKHRCLDRWRTLFYEQYK